VKVKFRVPNDGERRYICKYLYFPLRIKKEWRWFQWASIMQVWYSTFYGTSNKFLKIFGRWKNERWAD